MYHPIKCGCKKISSSEDMVERVILAYMSHHYDPELEDSKPTFLHNTLAHDDAPPYQVWLQKVPQLRRYFQMNIHWNFEPFFDLDLAATEQSNLFTRQSSL